MVLWTTRNKSQNVVVRVSVKWLDRWALDVHAYPALVSVGIQSVCAICNVVEQVTKGMISLHKDTLTNSPPQSAGASDAIKII